LEEKCEESGDRYGEPWIPVFFQSLVRIEELLKTLHKWSLLISSFLLIVLSSCAPMTRGIGEKSLVQGQRSHVTFVVFGDNRSGDDMYRKIVSIAMKKNPDFIVNVGDMIRTPGNLEEWDNFWRMSRPISVPYFLTVGNHDVNEQIPGSERIYEEQVHLPGNELYYSFTAGNSLFIVLDTSLADQEDCVTGDQYEWLEGVFAHSEQKHKFVFLHHPLYPVLRRKESDENGSDDNLMERDRLDTLFQKNNVDVVFAGHEHLYHRTTMGGVVYITTGGAGAPLYADDLNGGFHHFIVMNVDGDTVEGEVIDSDGMVRDRF
jgi:predicted phosphodiesterase